MKEFSDFEEHFEIVALPHGVTVLEKYKHSKVMESCELGDECSWTNAVRFVVAIHFPLSCVFFVPTVFVAGGETRILPVPINSGQWICVSFSRIVSLVDDSVAKSNSQLGDRAYPICSVCWAFKLPSTLVTNFCVLRNDVFGFWFSIPYLSHCLCSLVFCLIYFHLLEINSMPISTVWTDSSTVH